MMNVRPIKIKNMVENEVKNQTVHQIIKVFIVSLFLFGSVSIHMNRYTQTHTITQLHNIKA